MRISIAMATYNGARYLQEQLDSYVRQTRIPYELVVSDDGSSDGTLDILRRFQRQSPFQVKIYLNEATVGFTANFARALSYCSGDVVLLSDQDDVWLAHKVETLAAWFRAHPATHVAIHDGRLVDHRLGWHGATKRGQVLAGFGSDVPLVMGALTAVRREFLSYALPLPRGIVGHDVWLHLLARHLGVRAVMTDTLQAIRRHSSNTSGWIASSVEPIGKLNVWIANCRTPVASGYDDRIRMNDATRARLEGILAGPSCFSPDAVEAGLAMLRRERTALDERQRLAAAPYLRAKMVAVRLLLRGDYRYFNGLGSFLRDMSRR